MQTQPVTYKPGDLAIWDDPSKRSDISNWDLIQIVEQKDSVTYIAQIIVANSYYARTCKPAKISVLLVRLKPWHGSIQQFETLISAVDWCSI